MSDIVIFRFKHKVRSRLNTALAVSVEKLLTLLRLLNLNRNLETEPGSDAELESASALAIVVSPNAVKDLVSEICLGLNLINYFETSSKSSGSEVNDKHVGVGSEIFLLLKVQALHLPAGCSLKLLRVPVP